MLLFDGSISWVMSQCFRNVRMVEAACPHFSFLKDQFGHYMQNWPLKVSSGVLPSAAHVSVHHFSSCCVSLALNLHELCSFFFALFPHLCPCLHIALRISDLCYISVISL